MKVVQVTPEFPPPLVGGGGYHVYNLTRELVRKGVEVTVFTFNSSKDCSLMGKNVETQFGRVKVYRFPAFSVPRTIYAIAPTLIPSLLKEEPDIIHAHGYQFFTSDAAAIISRIKKKPLILTLHGFPRGFSKTSHKTYFGLIGKKTLKTTKKIIAVSSRVAEEFRAIGISKERIVIIPNGVNLQEFDCMLNGDNFKKSLDVKENERLILTIGRLEEIKGFQYLIMALAKIQSEANPIKLVIAGPEFNYGQQLRKLVVETGMEDKVIFYGSINGREKLDALAAANVAVVSSTYEGFSIFLLEAMAAGKPVIATKTGIAQELIQNGKNGFLIDPSDVEDLSEKIVAVLSDNHLSSLMSRESRNTAKIFDWGKIADQILLIYNQCLGNV
jgi:glycosyltransferase involved in cell wall biosynthesis